MSYDQKNFINGISRKLVNGEFYYYYIDSKKPVSKKDMERIRQLKIPPAWTDLWVSRDPNSAIQAIGKDMKGKKQYRYHTTHIKNAEKEKFLRLQKFIKSMPKLNRVIGIHSKLFIYERSKVISLMLQLVSEYHMRVGKEVYAKENKSYGISSLRKKHVKTEGQKIILKFRGKSKQKLRYTITDPEYINSINMLLKLDGDNLFQYVMKDEYGKDKIYKITDRDLNKYIQSYMGEEFTIKDFRTYGANLYFMKSILSETKKRTPKNKKVIKKNLINAIKSTAKQLKHTKAVSKKSYIMNFAIEMYQEDPQFFVDNKNTDPVDFLNLILKMYISTIS